MSRILPLNVNPTRQAFCKAWSRAAAIAQRELSFELSCRFPTVLAICHGDVEVREAYSGELKPDKLRDFVLKFAGGRRCSKCELSATSCLELVQLMHIILRFCIIIKC